MDLNISYTGAGEFPSKLRILLAGQAGVGKTTFASRFPNPLWVNAACGMTTLAKIGGVPYVNFSREMDLFAVKQMIESGSSEEAIGLKVDTLVIDSIDEMQRILLSERLKSENRSETKLEDWGWLNNRLHAIFGGLSQLPVHIIYVCHTKEVTFFENTIFKPALSGQFCEHIHEYVDMSLLMHASTVPQGIRPTDQESDFDVRRWVLSTPQFEAEWVHDKTGTLPAVFDSNETVFETVVNQFGSVAIPPSYSVKFSISGETAEQDDETADYEITADDPGSMLDSESRDEVVESFLNGLKVKTQG